MSATQHIDIHPGIPTGGVWCSHCALPCAYTIGIISIQPEGVSTLGTVTKCTGCS